MNSLIKKKIFRTSAILYEFLELSGDDLKKYKDMLGKYKYDLNVTLDNLKTVKNSMKFEEQANYREYETNEISKEIKE